MKTFYTKQLWQVTSFMSLVLFAISMQSAFSQFPVPDQALLFDDPLETYHTLVADSSGNNNNAYWWTYREGKDVMYGKYKPAEGKFGGAYHMGGYHICCTEMASPAMDFILLAGNHAPAKDAPGFTGDHPIYHKDMHSFTVAFWFKSDRDYTKTHTPCPPLENGMHEQEVLFSMGSGNGVAIKNFMGYYEVKMGFTPTGGTAESKAITYLFNGTGAVNKGWQHLAVTFDSASNGALAVYIDGVLGTAYLGDPNPLPTGYTRLSPGNSSTEIGAQNNGGQFGSVSGFWGTANIGQFCITAADTTYRTGWPSSGDFDDFVFYKDKVLTSAQVLELKTKGIKALLKGEDPNIGVKESKAITYAVYPNPTSGSFKINSSKSEIVDVKIYGILGNQVMQTRVNTNQNIDISSFEKGVYFVRVNNRSVSKILVK